MAVAFPVSSFDSSLASTLHPTLTHMLSSQLPGNSFRFLHSPSSRFSLFSVATSALKPQVPWTTAKLVPEALKHRLHVVEDPALISILGREKFADMVVFGAVGWQPGVSHILAFFFTQIQALGCFIATVLV